MMDDGLWVVVCWAHILSRSWVKFKWNVRCVLVLGCGKVMLLFSFRYWT